MALVLLDQIECDPTCFIVAAVFDLNAHRYVRKCLENVFEKIKRIWVSRLTLVVQIGASFEASAEVHRHLLLELGEISKIDITDHPWVAAESFEVFVMAHNDLLVFGDADIHLQHVATEVYSLFEGVHRVFWRVPRSTPVRNQMMRILHAFVNHLEFGALRMQDFSVLQEELEAKHVADDAKEVLAALKLVVDEAKCDKETQ